MSFQTRKGGAKETPQTTLFRLWNDPRLDDTLRAESFSDLMKFIVHVKFYVSTYRLSAVQLQGEESLVNIKL